MKAELDKKDIIALLIGSTPNYSVMDKIPKDLGSYVGGFVDDFKWNNIREDTPYSEKYLWELYLMCKNSWE